MTDALTSQQVNENDKPTMDIGLIAAGRFDRRRLDQVRASQAALARQLREWFPGFNWRFVTIQRLDIDTSRARESNQLLQLAAEEREARRWDMVIMITEQDLLPHYRAFALAALSRPLDAALISTARLRDDHDATGNAETADDNASDEAMVVHRLTTLLLHSLAHLGGLAGARGRSRILYRADSFDEMSTAEHLDESERMALQAAFLEIADTRLEETNRHEVSQRSRWQFIVQAIRINKAEIVDAVLAARPWEFPLRLSRLSTAAVSTVAILLMTAEAWDLALSQTALQLWLVAFAALAVTTTFVISRQQLLLGRHRELREQLVATRVSALLIIVAGLAITWICMLLFAGLATTTLFGDSLIAIWAETSHFNAGDIGTDDRLRMSMFCASVGLLIGSLGASFEDQHHFRHVIYVDEEL